VKAELTQALLKLDRAYEERDALHHELKRSLALQDIWPDAFTHGRCTTQVTGNPRRELTFTLKLANGERRSVPLEDVPVILWPETVKADIRQLGGFHGSYKYHKLLKGEDNAQNP
jgi:hypothetical protein